MSVELSPLTVLVGPNGAGKTTVLDGIQRILRCAREDITQECKQRWEEEHCRGSAEGAHTVLGVEFNGNHPPDRLSVEYFNAAPRSDNDPVHGQFRARLRGEEKETVPDRSFGFVNNLGTEFDAWVRTLPRAVHLRLDASNLALASYSEEVIPTMASDGRGLGAVIADLAARSPETLGEILASAQKILPGLVRIRAERAQVKLTEWDSVVINEQYHQLPRDRKVLGSRAVVDMLGASGIPLKNAGEGTALVIGLMTAMHQLGTSGVLLLDDIDRGLHPMAQQKLVGVLRGIMTAQPGWQVVATTHSPYLLDELDFSEVRIVTQADDGATLIGALTNHPQYARWKEHVRPGELWTSELEEWLKRRPPEAA